MYKYRVTKYNPAFRNENGAYLLDEWTAFSDVGKSFSGITLTKETYEVIEAAYLDVAISFLGESGEAKLEVRGLENRKDFPLAFRDGDILEGEPLSEAMRLILREKFWCRLEDNLGRFVHFGWDYYMYLGVQVLCENSLELASNVNLFVEEMPSPYRENE